MENDMLLKQLDDLQHKIDTMEFVTESEKVREWDGADVIISKRLNNRIKNWLGGQPLVISFQETMPARRAVITEFSKELSWLFYRLRDIFAGRIDYISKYDFYGLLAQSAIDYLEINKDSPQCKGLLLTVVNRARSFVESGMF